MPEKLSTLDTAELLTTEEDMAFFMSDALETADAGYIEHAREVVARAKAIIEDKKTILCSNSTELLGKQ